METLLLNPHAPKPFKAVEQEKLLSTGIKGFQLLDANGIKLLNKPISIEEAIKLSDFDVVIDSTMGVYDPHIRTRDLAFFALRGDEGACAFRIKDGSLASNNYFASEALTRDLIYGLFLWASKDCLEYLQEIVLSTIDTEEDNTTLYDFLSQLTISVEYRDVLVKADTHTNLVKAQQRIDTLIKDGFAPVDYYSNNDGDIYLGSDSYHAFSPIEDYEETDMTISEAIKFLDDLKSKHIISNDR